MRFISVYQAGIIFLCGLLFVTPSNADFIREGIPTFNSGLVPTSSDEFPRFSELVRELGPAVVNISVETEEDDVSAAAEQTNPFFKREPGQQARSLGSGCIVTSDGFIITNNHVVERAKRIIVRLLDDKAEYDAKVVGKDSKTDIALIKIEPKKELKVVYFGNSDELEIGEWVLAIGNQFQLGQTVTAGIVSAKSRRVPTKASGPYDAYIQTDAAINPGSSGGPLFNTRGQLIGVNTAIFSPGRSQFGGTGFNIGIGFSIPSNLVKTVINQIKEHGKVVRGLLGVQIQRVDSDMATALKLSSPDGAFVADIIPDSPASSAGFKRKDVIIKFGEQDIRDHEDLPLLVANTPIGTVASIGIIRDGKPMTLSAKIDELKDPSPVKKVENTQKSNTIGLTVQDVTAEIAKSLDMKAPAGVVVSAVQPFSVAEKAGLQRGDVIEEFDNQLVKDVPQFETLVEGLVVGKPILIMIRRAEGTRFLTLKLREAPKS